MLCIIENKYYSFSKPVISINPLISLYKQATNNPTFKCFISNIDHYNIIELDTDDLFIHCIEFKNTIVYFESLENANSFSNITIKGNMTSVSAMHSLMTSFPLNSSVLSCVYRCLRHLYAQNLRLKMYT